MPPTLTAYPHVATRDEWLAARKKLLAREREVTHLRDAVNAERRRLPMVKVEKDYVSRGPTANCASSTCSRAGPAVHPPLHVDRRHRRGLPELHDGRRPHVHQKDRALLNAKGVTFAAVSRAPYASIARYKGKHPEWTFPWYSSRDNDFSYDYHVTLDPARAPIEYNYRSLDDLHAAGFSDDLLRGDWPGASVFVRRGDEVFHTYSAFARGLDHSAAGYPFLDLTPYGRQETGRTRLRVGHKALTRWECRWTSRPTGSDHHGPNAGPVPALMARSYPSRVWPSG